MSCVWLSFLLVATVVLLADSTHYRGATMSWQHTGGNEAGNTRKISVNFKVAWKRDTADGKTAASPRMSCDEDVIRRGDAMGQPVPWRCLSNNCGQSTIGTMTYICTSFSIEENWSSGGNSVVFDFPFNGLSKIFRFGNDPGSVQGCCWIENLKNLPIANINDIRYFTEINLTPRPASASRRPGMINNSPITDLVPFVSARAGCPYNLNIPNTDPDFDSVRCRWAESNSDNTKDECGAVCHALDMPPFNASLDEENCQIQWTPPSETGNYGLALVLEDYLPEDPNNAMSKVPLQFLIKVFEATLPCQDKPVFVDTPLNPFCIAISSGDALTFVVKVKHTNPSHTVSFLVSSRPAGMSQSPLIDVPGSPGLKEATLEWTPSNVQLDQPFFLCFSAIDDVDGATDLNCITLITGRDPPNVLLGTRMPEGDTPPFTPNTEKANISFTKQIRRPTVSRHIRIFKHSDDSLVETIDTKMSDQVSISYDNLTASFTLKGFYPGNTKYYILMAPGAFVGLDIDCDGGGPATDGVLNKDDWTFTTPRCLGQEDCHPNATCISFTCVCKTGFTGDGVLDCTDINECDTNTDNCHANANCFNTEGSFTCTCHTGYTGDGVTCTDIDECTEGTDNCHADATCTNTPGSFECDCKPGYTGDGVTCTDIDECTEDTDNCHANATCTNTPGSFECDCKPGYTGDGVTCTDIDECTEDTDNCHADATCTNTPGSFECDCKPGYTGDGVTCIDIDECTEGTDNCHADATCTNTPGSFECDCKPGYTGDGVTCTDIDECTENKDNCHANANCTNTEGSFTCTCHTGYTGDGVTCIDINECAIDTDNCHVNADCTNTQGSFTCQCKPGFTGDGVLSCPGCDDDTDCHSNGECVVSSGTRECVCKMGFRGDGKNTCDDIDECAEELDNCHENAYCTNTTGSFFCTCKEGFSGDGVISCIDVSNCTLNWDVQRDRWVDKDEIWKNVTRNCDGLGDDLHDPDYNVTDSPINQWRDVIDNYIDTLNAWLKVASDLNLPGVPSSIQFDESDPDKLWEDIKFYLNHFQNLWYEHVGEPNGLMKPEASGDCDDEQVEDWVQCTEISDKGTEAFEDVFKGRCDTR